MRILLLAYYFPPCGGPAALRAMHWALYMPAAGLDLTVIAPRAGVYPMVDETLMQSLPAKLEIHRVGGFTPSSHPALRQVRGGSFAGGGASHSSLTRRVLRGLRDHLFIPDEYVGFVPAAVEKALELHARAPFDAVLTLSHPLSVHLAGRALKRKLGLPWVTEFGDPWSENWHRSARTLTRRWIEPGMERSVLTECDLAVATTESLRDRWRNRFPDLPPDRYQSVPIGYDERAFHGIVPERSPRWTLAYVGALYHDRSATSFLDGLGEYLAGNPGERERMRAVFLGAMDEANKTAFRAAVKRYALEGVVEERGFRSHREALELLCGADALLYIGGLPPEGDLTVQSKVYEYLRAGKPVLAISREVEAVRILGRGAGLARAEQGDGPGAARALARIRSLTPEPASPAVAREYEVEALATRLALYLRHHVGSGGVTP